MCGTCVLAGVATVFECIRHNTTGQYDVFLLHRMSQLKQLSEMIPLCFCVLVCIRVYVFVLVQRY